MLVGMECEGEVVGVARACAVHKLTRVSCLFHKFVGRMPEAKGPRSLPRVLRIQESFKTISVPLPFVSSMHFTM